MKEDSQTVLDNNGNLVKNGSSFNEMLGIKEEYTDGDEIQESFEGAIVMQPKYDEVRDNILYLD